MLQLSQSQMEQICCKLGHNQYQNLLSQKAGMLQLAALANPSQWLVHTERLITHI